MTNTTLIWLRRDLRLDDHPALSAACGLERPVVFVFLRDAWVDDLGAAAAWRLQQSLAAFADSLAARGHRLILRSGAALQVLPQLVAETGASAVWWTRAYDPDAMARDAAVKAALRDQGIEARSFGGHLLFEPWTVATKTGGPYRVYSPFWRAVQGRDVDAPRPAPAQIRAPAQWPASEELQSWTLGARMNRGAAVLARYSIAGEAAAHAALEQFMADRIGQYRNDRDKPALSATSGLSEYLTYGEISPNRIWQAARWAQEAGTGGAETFLKELVWREFAYHLMYHSPHILHSNWRDGWARFPWNTDAEAPEVLAWKQGRTGIRLVDAAMREMYVTGRMHNRARMIVASYLTKHLMTHWRIGMDWFADCLTDWDPASNAMGWQWVAGSGPDAAPYFRVFNPDGQREKFDPDGAYLRRWIAEGQLDPPATARAYFQAMPRSWDLAMTDLYPAPVMDLAQGRARALHAYETWSKAEKSRDTLPAT